MGEQDKISVKRVNISLSPENEYNRRANVLPKLFILKRQKGTSKSLRDATHCMETYSIAYIGENSGELTISSRKSVIPRLSRLQISREARIRRISPNFCIHSVSENKSHKYYRPKPLTPASIGMRDFSEYTHKVTCTPKSVKTLRKINKLMVNDLAKNCL